MNQPLMKTDLPYHLGKPDRNPDDPPPPPAQTPDAPVKEPPDHPDTTPNAPVREPGPTPPKRFAGGS